LQVGKVLNIKYSDLIFPSTSDYPAIFLHTPAVLAGVA